MAGLCEGDNEPPGSLKARVEYQRTQGDVPLSQATEEATEAQILRCSESISWFELHNNDKDIEEMEGPHLWSNGQRVWLRNQVARFAKHWFTVTENPGTNPDDDEIVLLVNKAKVREDFLEFFRFPPSFYRHSPFQ
ncbi:hypothetical protein ANN_18860 [Periplaneta americana]|uniref:Uncharacterized protein n=1 Tax=Periplaneta americana TaxID=6978 RepID=A0ABQ8SS28_PERAM|nr:hypothetical protein ANN_18860 [Periplaneta americana]